MLGLRRQTRIIRGTKEINMFRRNILSSCSPIRIFMVREDKTRVYISTSCQTAWSWGRQSFKQPIKRKKAFFFITVLSLATKYYLIFKFPCIMIYFTKMTNKMQLCSIIYYFFAALHVSRDIFAHHQEHLNCITASGSNTTMMPVGSNICV